MDIGQKIAYNGMMLNGVPNVAFLDRLHQRVVDAQGRADCDHFCRLLAHMDQGGSHLRGRAALPAHGDPPLLDFKAGYVQRSLHELPRQGMHSPWELAMSYRSDARVLREGQIEDRNLRFTRVREPDADSDQVWTATSLSV